MNGSELDKQKQDKLLANRGAATRNADAKRAHTEGDARAGIRAYCAGNKWLTENAKAVGNW